MFILLNPAFVNSPLYSSSSIILYTISYWLFSNLFWEWYKSITWIVWNWSSCSFTNILEKLSLFTTTSIYGSVNVKCVVPWVNISKPFLFSLSFMDISAVSKSSSVCRWGKAVVRQTTASNFSVNASCNSLKSHRLRGICIPCLSKFLEATFSIDAEKSDPETRYPNSASIYRCCPVPHAQSNTDCTWFSFNISLKNCLSLPR